jgi:sporulation protein YlmC with PRC-barrel domain
MKRGVSILAATAAAIASLTALALADPAAIPANVFLSTQGGGQILARDFLLGNQVYNADGKIIGDIEDLILNSNNQIEGVVMGTGGFAGFGEKHVGVVLSALQIKNDNGKITVTLPQATKEVLEALEPFKRSTPQKSLLDRAIAKAQELSDKGSVTAKDAYDKAKEEAGPALEEAKKQAKDTYEEIKKEAGPALEEAKKQAKEAYDSARKAVENMPDSGPAAQGTPPVPPESKPATTPESQPASPEPAPAPKP